MARSYPAMRTNLPLWPVHAPYPAFHASMLPCCEILIIVWRYTNEGTKYAKAPGQAPALSFLFSLGPQEQNVEPDAVGFKRTAAHSTTSLPAAAAALASASRVFKSTSAPSPALPPLPPRPLPLALGLLFALAFGFGRPRASNLVFFSKNVLADRRAAGPPDQPIASQPSQIARLCRTARPGRPSVGWGPGIVRWILKNIYGCQPK